MIKEEAIKLLEDVCEIGLPPVSVEFFNTVVEALQMAIEALKLKSCEDAVSRETVISAFEEWFCDYRYGNRSKSFRDIVNALPPLAPKQRTGKWIKTSKAVMGEGYMWYCDKCEHQVYQDTSRPYPSERYCPNCGAKMGGVSE